MIVDCS